MIGRPLLIVVISISIVWILAANGYQYVMDHFFRPVNGSDQSEVVFEVPKGSSTSDIAKSLYESELIRNKAVFKVFVDFMGKGGKLRSGTYALNRAMSVEDIIDLLVLGDGTKQTIVTFRLVEGMTVEEMAKTLMDKKAIKDHDRFLELAKAGKELKAFDTASQIPANSNPRRYMLEGYLFPDTYEVYEGSTEETVINKLIVRFFDIFNDEFMLRAQEMNMTMDQIVTLASLIEKEAKTADFYKVSAVFHNRIAKDMLLQSDAAIQYIKNSNKLIIPEADLKIESPYNTHLHKGLPAGPICNPSKAALQAALYPDEATLKEGYLYFCLKDPKSGELAYAKTLKEHNANVALYRELWQQYDNAGTN